MSTGNAWPRRLWSIDQPHRWNGGNGGGVGYTLPASLGAALANQPHGRLTVAMGGDGDFMFAPGTFVDRRASPHPDAQCRAQRALAAVKSGQPAAVDVVSERR